MPIPLRRRIQYELPKQNSFIQKSSLQINITRFQWKNLSNQENICEILAKDMKTGDAWLQNKIPLYKNLAYESIGIKEIV